MATSASIDVREGKYIITPFSYTTQRLGVMTEPIFIYDTLPEVITNLAKALDCSKSGLSVEEGERISDIAFKKLLKSVGVRSHIAYVRPVTKSVSIREEDGVVYFTPREKVGKSFSPLSEERKTAPLADAQALTTALQAALALCR